MAQRDGHYMAAATLQKESAAIARAIGERSTLVQALRSLAGQARLQENQEESTALLKEALAVAAELGYPYQVAPVLAGLAGAAACTGDHARAARLLGAAEALRDASGTREMPDWPRANDQDVAAVRAALGDEAFAAAWAEGRAMSMEQAVAYALGEASSA
ncbi:MAG TPA: hypothetical protein VML54_14135 [Candidatus Limnocylindrales bacterium]|nr:hypothetical protein [Candidatus Limnocylindrales bacterium]